jgi:hypothetical protein
MAGKGPAVPHFSYPPSGSGRLKHHEDIYGLVLKKILMNTIYVEGDIDIVKVI